LRRSRCHGANAQEGKMFNNLLYYGDNLTILRRYIKDESVDLVYLDPPWNKKKSYNVLFAEQNGSRSPAQIKAFEDTWRWDQAAVKAYEEIVEAGGQVSRAMQAFQQMLGECDMLAYLTMMAPRLVELWRVLKSSGSIYLHCDPTVSHYLKILMDAVFGPRNFQNEVVWSYRTGGVSKRYWPRKHDAILFYSKRTQFFFAPQQERIYYEKPFFTTKRDEEGRYYADVYVRDVWDIKAVINVSRERLGYPTQKPEELMERIINASCPKGGIVLDPFCGCGTTIAVAHRLKRRWIGIDITHLAINLIRHRLQDTFGNEVAREYAVIGEPTDLPGAKVLAKQDPFQFQWWALGLVGARPADPKKGSDRGIDGRLYFHDEPQKKGKTKQIILSVKSGGVSVKDIRDLRGVMERENAEIGVLITLRNPTKPMRSEAAAAGFYSSPWGKHPRLQILTIAELMEGKGIDYPPSRQVNVTFKKAPRVKNEGATPIPLPLPDENQD